MFGKDKELKSIEQRVAEAEPKVKQWQEELQKVSETPGLNAREKFITSTVANLDAGLKTLGLPSLAYIGIMGSVGLDLTPLGGGRKGAFKAIAEVKTLQEGMALGRSIGIADDLLLGFAEDAVKAGNAKAAKDLVDHYATLQETTRAMGGSLYRQVAANVAEGKRISTPEGLPPLPKLPRGQVSESVSEEVVGTLQTKRFGEIEKRQGEIPTGESTGYGQTKIAAKNLGLDDKQIVKLIDTLPIKSETANRIILQDKNYRVLLSKDWFGKPTERPWLMNVVKVREAGVEPATSAVSGLRSAAELPASSKTSIPKGKVNETVGIADPPVSPRVGIPTGGQLKELSKRLAALKGKPLEDVTKEIDDISQEVVVLDDVVESMPGKGLMKYVSKATGRLPEVTGKETMRAISGSGKTVKTSDFGRRGDDIAINEHGFRSVEDAQEAVDASRERRSGVLPRAQGAL